MKPVGWIALALIVSDNYQTDHKDLVLRGSHIPILRIPNVIRRRPRLGSWVPFTLHKEIIKFLFRVLEDIGAVEH